MLLDIFEAIKLRRSVRVFSKNKLDDWQVEKILDAARQAPSAGNIQPWKFIVVKKQELKKKLAEAALNQLFIEQAPVVIVVCADEIISKQVYGIRGANLYCIQDTAAATENMLLAVCGLGLGACWVGAFYEDKVKAALNIPNNLRAVAIVPIGHPAERPALIYKRPLEEIVHNDAF